MHARIRKHWARKAGDNSSKLRACIYNKIIIKLSSRIKVIMLYFNLKLSKKYVKIITVTVIIKDVITFGPI